MAYYTTCPDCGASLDPGERCDCQEESPEQDAWRRAGAAENDPPAKREPA